MKTTNEYINYFMSLNEDNLLETYLDNLNEDNLNENLIEAFNILQNNNELEEGIIGRIGEKIQRSNFGQSIGNVGTRLKQKMSNLKTYAHVTKAGKTLGMIDRMRNNQVAEDKIKQRRSLADALHKQETDYKKQENDRKNNIKDALQKRDYSTALKLQRSVPSSQKKFNAQLDDQRLKRKTESNIFKTNQKNDNIKYKLKRKSPDNFNVSDTSLDENNS